MNNQVVESVKNKNKMKRKKKSKLLFEDKHFTVKIIELMVKFCL